MATLDDFFHLALALGIGLLIGLERGWHGRAAPEGSRVAGFRTIALIGLTGGVLGLIARQFGAGALTAGLGGIVLLLGIGYHRDLQISKDISATTIIAALLAALLGLLTTIGYPKLGVSAAVVTALILVFKPTLHDLLQRIETIELKAVFRFLLISVVILPLLPNQNYGPYDALNPYIIWWMVVLVSGISFAGYIAVRLWGARKGLLLTASIGALVSSTAITLAFSREARVQSKGQSTLACGIVIASTIMVVRMAVVASIVAPVLSRDLILICTPMALVGMAASYLSAPKVKDGGQPDIKFDNPFDLRVALFFGVLLAVILLGAKVLEAQFGARGVYGIAAITGLFDVDAMTVSAAQMTYTGLTSRTAAIAVAVAGLSNTVSKAVMAMVIGGASIRRTIALSFGAMVLAGVAAIKVLEHI